MPSLLKIALWLRAGHFIALFMWLGGLFAIFWMLRLHANAPKEVHEKFTLMERAIALSTDIAATVAIVTGFAMAFKWNVYGGLNLFTMKDAGWLHVKVTAVILLVLPVHGMLRARIKKFGMGQISPPPQWQWSLLLVGITTVVIAAATKFATFK